MGKRRTLFTKKGWTFFFIAVLLISGAAYATIVSAHSSHQTSVVRKALTQPSVHQPLKKSSAINVPPPSSVTQISPQSSSTLASTAPQACSGCWLPKVGISLQWQLQGTIDQSYAADLYDIDGFDNSSMIVSQLHAKGHKVVCYIDAG
ncbi:MAG: endo alpha-1,4 polygalactosaminidase, partial [Ktedonobacteraceae bacterium]|nr:endo alpha-1,4 polygalactosaminidase [Ktedonobacteraceae bacterium]